MRELNLLVAERAEREGLLDVAYATVDSPFGPLTVAATERGLVMLAYPEHDPDDGAGAPGRRAVAARARGAGAPGRRPARARRVLRGPPARVRHPDRLLALARLLPQGAGGHGARSATAQTSTYAGVAAGRRQPKAVRAAGSGLGSNPIPVVVPCHRVLRTGGALGGYTGGLERKEFLLSLERR